MFSELVGHTWHLLLVRWAGRRGAVHRPNLLRAETCPFPPSLCYPPPSSLPGQRGGRSPCRTRNSLTLCSLGKIPFSQSQAELFQVSADQWWPPGARGAPTQLRGPTRSPLTIQAWDLGWDAQKVTDLQKCQGVKGHRVAPHPGQWPWGCEWHLSVPVASREGHLGVCCEQCVGLSAGCLLGARHCS